VAKKDTNANILVVILVVFSIIIFGGAFAAGYFYKDQILGFFERNLNKEKTASLEKAGEKPVLTTSKDLPEGFPKDFPVYPQSTLEDSWTALGNSTKGISVIWVTKGAVKDVYDFYKENLQKGGWEISSEYSQEESSTVTFEKENISGFVGITKGEGAKTLISVTMGIK
jgi:hypothetical protein